MSKNNDKKDLFSGLDDIDKLFTGLDDAILEIDDSFREATDRINTIDVDKHVEPVKTEESLPEGPKIQYVDVILREDIPADDEQCEDSKKHKGLQFCKVEGVVRKYRYDPDVFKKATGAELDELQEKIDECPLCKIDPNHSVEH